MAKDPAFLFYPADWVTGTMGMTFEEKGAYIDLLMMQFSRGHMAHHMVIHMVGHIWDNVKDKFIQDDDGLWYNERLEEEKLKRQNFTKSRRNNLSRTNDSLKNKNKTISHMETHMDSHMETHMENVNININKDKNKGGVGGKCLFKNSGVTVEDIRMAFDKTTDIRNADPQRYFNDMLDWSNGKGEMRKDWVSVSRVFARRDLDAGKLKIKKSVNTGTNQADALPEDYGKASPTAMTLEEYRKQKQSL